MAKGATDDFWEEQDLPAVYKHEMLHRYVPVFAGKTGTYRKRIVIVDGYAGRGRHADGTPGSTQILLSLARGQQTHTTWECLSFEPNRISFVALKEVVAEYPDVVARAECQTIEEGLPEVLRAAQGNPLFLLLDPCGLGMSYHRLVDTFNRSDRIAAPTEALLNFSMDALRRIGGLLESAHRNEKSIARQDDALGGTWWHKYLSGGVWNPGAVVEEFSRRLSDDLNASVVAFPVSKRPKNQPLYYLVFITRSPHGLWAISEAAARATEKWYQTFTDHLNEEDALFALDSPWQLDQIEVEAIPEIMNNIAHLIPDHAPFEVVERTSEILGDYFDFVRGVVVRRAIKELHKRGLTASDGVGKHVETLVVKPPG